MSIPSPAAAVSLLAHIGKVPVEEWLPFLVPMLALYLYGRRKTKARREALEQLPSRSDQLDPIAVDAVMARWQSSGHTLSREHLALLFPPGPDERSAGELADQLREDRPAVEGLLRDLERQGYLELDEHDDFDGPHATLTAKGHDLLDQTERALIEAQGTALPTRGTGKDRQGLGAGPTC